MDSDNDQLAHRAASDPLAFAALYDLYFSRVYTYLRYRCGDPAEADDLAAQVFERLLANLASYRPERGGFEPWLFTIVRNALADHLRRQRRAWLFWQNPGRLAATAPGPEESLIHAEEMRSLFAALDQLDERARDIVALKFFARLTNRQIAELTRLSESNVGVILFRALAQLRNVLARPDESLGWQGVVSR